LRFFNLLYRHPADDAKQRARNHGHFTLGGGAAPTPMFRAMAGLAATPIAAGEQTVSADVSVTFEIR